ncbi:hypothetical protein [uncultured Croceitalea sp.]|uniref:hypothetical protein n=1 Tax=uncultured Croceitalea sp. TaxID=1798908 RepID=UPI00374F0609
MTSYIHLPIFLIYSDTHKKMTSHNYIEWFDATEMYEHSKVWFSELSFIKEEQSFLNNLIWFFAIKPLSKKEFKELDDFKITINQKQVLQILKRVQKHMNQLEIMLDDVNQLKMERAYRETHKKLYSEVNECLLDFRNAKQKGFSNLTSILRKDKKMALGNPDYKLRKIKN